MEAPASAAPLDVLKEHAVILFDGVCNLCNSSVNFVIDHDPAGYFKLAALQSEEAAPFLEHFGLQADYLDSIVLLDGDRVYRNSDAALHVARRLDGAWPLLYAFIAVPRPIRDAVYAWVARNRYAWFGKRDRCRIPTPDVMDRFL